tara:strand:+ start:1744 stop:1968 length:225 start_codon:yes stop_codon:yes gene_type:complete
MSKVLLQSCPFCGSKEIQVEDHRLRFSVSCAGCSACVLGDIAPEPDTQEECDRIDFKALELSAINNWNRRHDSS